MPNNFRHQTYSDAEPIGRYELLQPAFPAQRGTSEFVQIAEDFRKRIEGKVDEVYLIHGTFVGDDALGWTAQISKLFPNLGSQIAVVGKHLVDLISGESGNYTEEFRALLETSIVDSGTVPPVRQFVWSSENTHTGRCRAAIELLHKLMESQANGKRKFLFFCHSHAGNVLALLTNLLAADTAVRQGFIQILRPLFNNEADVNILSSVDSFLQTKPASKFELNIVTFGTPIRYGWDPAGYNQLLHFVNHSPRGEHPNYVSPLEDLSLQALKSYEGDLVQQLGIASTNFFPFLLDKTLLAAEREMSQLLQSGIERKDVIKRIKIGMRVHESGSSLLVDYGAAHCSDQAGLARLMVGHAIYTRMEWLAFHLAEIGRKIF